MGQIWVWGSGSWRRTYSCSKHREKSSTPQIGPLQWANMVLAELPIAAGKRAREGKVFAQLANMKDEARTSGQAIV